MWQELFRGAEETLLTPDRYYDHRDVSALKQQFLAPTPEERREKLMPFVWGTLVPQGVLFGDRDAGSEMHVTNGLNFSYPGYSETLPGHSDARIPSNDNIPNPNVTVLEWLNKEPGFGGRVAAFGAWEVIDGIVNKGRCGFEVNASYAPELAPPLSPTMQAINEQKQDCPRIWDDEVFDAPQFATTMEYVKLHHPRVLFVSFGETDDWAHGGNYGEYLLSAHRVDSYLQRLWSALQSMPEYAGKTTLLFTTDHGRGSDAEGWKSHGEKLPDSRFIFAGMMGPGVDARGVLRDAPSTTQSQIAATIAALLGKDWMKAEPKAGRPLPLMGPKP